MIKIVLKPTEFKASVALNPLKIAGEDEELLPLVGINKTLSAPGLESRNAHLTPKLISSVNPPLQFILSFTRTVVLVLLHGRPKTMHNRIIATFDTL